MVVPHEVALDFDQLDVLAVELADDPRAPTLVKLGQLFGEVNLLHVLIRPHSAYRLHTLRGREHGTLTLKFFAAAAFS